MLVRAAYHPVEGGPRDARTQGTYDSPALSSGLGIVERYGLVPQLPRLTGVIHVAP